MASTELSTELSTGPPTRLTRRSALTAGLTLAAGAAAGAAYSQVPLYWRARLGLVDLPEPFIPNAPAGRVRLETVSSAARGRDVGLFTAVPHGYGDGAGLPVVVVLHGVSATAADYQPFGLPRFLTAAVRGGAAPFVLAGADGGVQYWEPDPASGDDSQAMVLEEMPRWLEQRGFDASRRALWGWSMGGYGGLRMAEVAPGWARGVAAFSPAVGPGDAVFADVEALAGTALGFWCGTDDPLYDNVRALVEALPRRPPVATFGPGGHTRVFWNDQTLPAFAFLSQRLHA
jgi:S-formylglutathione hydrolase FrmB